MNNTRRGLVVIFGAKITFMIAGYALYIGLGSLLDLETFGLYGVLFAIVSLINMVVINGTMQTISRFVAAHPEQASGIRGRGFLYQTVFVAALLSLYYLAAPLIARLLSDETLVPLLRISALITGFYAFYAVNVGYLNGQRRFVRQAILDITFAVLRVSFILAMVAMGYELYGVLFGFAAAALCILVLSFAVAGGSVSGPATEVTAKQFTSYAFSVIAVAILVNGVMNADILVLKATAHESIANTLAGHYTAAQSVARIPYALMVTVTLVLFPVIASLRGDDEATRRRRMETTSRAMSMTVTLLAGMVAVVAPIATRVLLVLYSPVFAPAGQVLSVLVAGVSLLTVLNVGITIISGAGRPAMSAAILLVTIAIQIVGAVFWVPVYGARGAAMATTLASGVGLLLALAYLRYAFGTRIRAFGILLTAGCSAAIVGLGLGFLAIVPEPGKLLTVLYCGTAYTVYLCLVGLGGVLLGTVPVRERVLWVTKPLDPPFNDGAKVLPRSLLAHVDPSKVAICVSKKAQDGDWPEELEVLRLYSSSKSFVGRFYQNVRVFGYLVLARFHYRGLHFFFAPSRTTVRAIRFLKLLSPGVQFVQTIMSRPLTFEGSGDLLFGDVVIAQSEQTRTRLARSSGRTDIRLIRPAVHPLARVLASVNDAPGPSSPPTLLFAGDIDHGGALPHIAAIIPPLLEQERDLRFVFSIRVKGPDTLVRARSFYSEHLERFGDRVEMHIDHPDFESLLNAQDAMIFPAEDLYTKVDAPLVVLETMARGKPVFLMDRAPLSEIPGAELSPMLVAADDEAMVILIQRYLAEPGLIPPDSLREIVASRFSARRAAQALVECYEQ